MSTEDLFRRSRELFDEALQLPEEQRLGFIREKAGHDDALHRELISLLQAGARVGDFLGGSAIASIGGESAWLGKNVGNYRLEGVIAGGGMGVVFRARQEHPRREVALKLIRGDSISPRALKRFELEAELLGRLDHPGIARIYDAGTTDAATGRQPYFVMELIEGLSLTEYVRQNSLPESKRLELMILICEAVNHAHQHGIVHRDLKPANILVREDGQPKILDFGVARTTDSDLQASTFHTDPGQVIGTLQYMSPEQVRGHPGELDTRSDVYALGVLAYELLTGHLPQSLKGKSIVEAVRVIEEKEPSTLGRGDRNYPSDLETIVRKCLQKDKSQRYDSPGELAADLRRYLASEPILARSPSAVYQFKKFARRNRGVVVTAGLGLLVLFTGVVVSVAGWTKAERARVRAEVESQKSAALSDFMVGLLKSPDPSEEGPEVRVVEILANAGDSIDKEMSDQPEVAASAHQAIASSYRGLGLYDLAERHWRASLVLLESILPPDDPGLYGPLESLADLFVDEGKLEAADSILVTIRRVMPKLSPPEFFDALHFIGSLEEARGELDSAVVILEDAHKRSLKELGEDHHATILIEATLGNLLWQVDRPEDARPLLEAACARTEADHGPDHPDLLGFRNNLAGVYLALGDKEGALEMYQAVLEAKKRVMGEMNTSTAIGYHNVAFQLGKMDRGEEALPYHDQAIHIFDELLGEDDIRPHLIRAAKGTTLLALERFSEAEAILVSGYRNLQGLLGKDHVRCRRVAKALSELYEQTGQESNHRRYLALSAEPEKNKEGEPQ